MLKSILQYFLRVFTKKIIKKYKPDIVGITGSVGKTSSKEAIAAVLASKFTVRKSTKNYNNEIGLPLTVIGASKTPGGSFFGWCAVFGRALLLIFGRDKNYPEILVLEMGADKPGDIQYLTEIAPCKVGVITFISHAHTEFFKTIKKIAQEKRIIISHLQRDGFAVLNYDSEFVMQSAGATKAEILTYGMNEGADLRATDINLITDSETGWPTGINFKVLYKGNIVPVFLAGVIARPFVSAALAGLSVGTIFGVNLVEGAQSLASLGGIPGHMNLMPGIKNTLIIDDTYNSSPEASKSALNTLVGINIKNGAERYAVFADMLELGTETENAHREIGLKIAELGINYLITVGEAAKYVAHAARDYGMPDHSIAMFSDSISAGRFLQDKLEQGDVVLVKGSQSMRMERVVKEIMAEPLRAEELLVRQGREWK